VDLIPRCARHPDPEEREFNIRFGPQHADIGSHGRYQFCGSRQGEALFWAETEDIERRIPESERLLKELYPYYCPEEYLSGLAGREGEEEVIFEKGVFLSFIQRPWDALETLLKLPASHGKYQIALYHMIKSLRAMGMEKDAAEVMEKVTDENVLEWLKKKE